MNIPTIPSEVALHKDWVITLGSCWNPQPCQWCKEYVQYEIKHAQYLQDVLDLCKISFWDSLFGQNSWLDKFKKFIGKYQ